MAVSLVAAVLAGYLAFLALVKGTLPPGCGSGSGCGEVLSSSWARVFGLPVSLPACLVYLVMAGLAFPARRSVAARVLLAVLAGSVLAGAAWFTFLQLVVLRSICVYCMTDHFIGVVAAILALIVVIRSGGGLMGAFAAAGLFPVLLMVGLQLIQPQVLYHLDMPTGKDFDLVQDGERLVGLLDGQLQLRLASEPHLGDVGAEEILALMVDYACPHCRRLHHAARELQQVAPSLVVVMMLPTPVHPSCNPHVENVADRFAESCELARLSLAVHAVDPGAWEQLDAWLFEPEKPRSLNESRAYAVQLIGEAPLMQGLTDREVEQRLQRNVAAFGQLPSDETADRRVPVTFSPGRSPIVGPVEEAETLRKYIGEE